MANVTILWNIDSNIIHVFVDAVNHDRPITVGSIPYRPGFNPYQKLFTGALEEAGVRVIRIPPRKWFPLQFANRVECDILHLDWPHDWYSGKNGMTRRFKQYMYLSGLASLRAKVVWTLHNLFAHDAKDMVYEHRMIQALIDCCDGILVFSETAKAELKKRYSVSDQTSIQKVFHGHYLDCYPNNCTREAARTFLGVPGQQKLLVTVGAIRPYKGIDSLISEFGQNPISGIKWIIAGESKDSEFHQRLQMLVQNANRHGCDIEFHNRLIPDHELQYYFNACDVCILPFENVLNSGSLLMAMSFGCPIIAPSMGSIPEVVCNRWSYLYDPADSGSLRTSILRSMECVSRQDVAEIRADLINFVRQKYSWTNVGTELKRWYEKLCNRVDA